MIKFVLIVAVVATAVLVGSARPASAASFDPGLAGLVQSSLKMAETRPDGTGATRTPLQTYVRCFDSRQEFEKALVWRFWDTPSHARQTIAYYAGGGTINVRAGTCDLAGQFVNGYVTQDTAGAFETILHEAIHRQGVDNERTTEALAIATMRAAGQIVEFNKRYPFGFDKTTESYDAWYASAPAGDRAMKLAWKQSQRYAAFSYRSSWAYVYKLSRTTSWAEVAPW
jgi:hypothetical protein